MKNEGLSARVTITMTPEELATVDAWMFERKLRRGRSEAIRQLIALGLTVSTEPAAPPKTKRKRS